MLMVATHFVIFIHTRDNIENLIIFNDCDLIFNCLILLLPSTIVLDTFNVRYLLAHIRLNAYKLFYKLLLLLLYLQSFTTWIRSTFKLHILSFFPSLFPWFLSEYEFSGVAKLLFFCFVVVDSISIFLSFLHYNFVFFISFARSWFQKRTTFVSFTLMLNFHEYIVI